MLRSFFHGRYGFDTLFYGLVIIQGVLIALAWVASVLGFSTVYYICFYVQMALFVYTFYRTLSKKIDKRQRENARFMALLGKLKSKKAAKKQNPKASKKQSGQKRDCFFTSCPHCKANLRLPNVVGKHGVKCPRCGKDFDLEI